MTANQKMIEISKAFKKQIEALADDTRFESFSVDGFIDQLSDDIYEMEQEFNNRQI